MRYLFICAFGWPHKLPSFIGIFLRVLANSFKNVFQDLGVNTWDLIHDHLFQRGTAALDNFNAVFQLAKPRVYGVD